MILEGICTTLNADGSLNIAPMGPVVDEALSSFLFRPFTSSTTYQNLKRSKVGVFHVVDDVLLIARLVTDTLHLQPATFPAVRVAAHVLEDCCRWYEFEVLSIDDSRPRTEIQTRVVNVGRRREFWGLNRAKHAVLEAAILATRLHLLPRQEVESQLAHLHSAVEKTAGEKEREAFELIVEFTRRRYGNL